MLTQSRLWECDWNGLTRESDEKADYIDHVYITASLSLSSFQNQIAIKCQYLQATINLSEALVGWY
jgi:hypothetical protein